MRVRKVCGSHWTPNHGQTIASQLIPMSDHPHSLYPPATQLHAEGARLGLVGVGVMFVESYNFVDRPWFVLGRIAHAAASVSLDRSPSGAS